MNPATRARLGILCSIGVIVAVGLGFWILRSILIPFAVGLILAVALYPVVRRVEGWLPWRKRWPGAARSISIILIYLVGLSMIAGGLFVIIPPAYSQGTQLVRSIPNVVAQARETLESWNDSYTRRVPLEIRQRIELGINEAADDIAAAIQYSVFTTLATITGALSLILGLLVVPILLFYLLKDGEGLISGIVGLCPTHLKPHLQEGIAILNRVAGQYLRGQLLLGLVVGTVAFVGLTILGVPYAILLGLVNGVAELIPVVGPWLGAIPGIIVTLATAPEKIVWVLLLYLGIQLLENTLLVPRIQGNTLKLNPAVIILTILIGSQLFGFWGLIFGPPAVAVARELFLYFRSRWMAAAMESTERPD